MKSPLQIHRERKEKKELEYKIRDVGRRHQLTLEEDLRRELISLHIQYKYKYLRDYKG